ncbi:MAG: hypothetical protein H6Q14_1102 [Bacteroidetes bacterium]|nr:hypothetical protein [Bacteroidota bacterium]
MKRAILFIIAIATLTPSMKAQTLYVPSSTSGIGSSSNENVGIGSQSPKAKFEVVGTGGLSVSAANLDQFWGYDLSFLKYSCRLLLGWNYSAGGGEQNFFANRGAGGIGGFSFFDYGNDGKITNLMTMLGAGNVGIGTSNPQYKLDVKGQIRATEVLVQSVDQFADFVFDKGYRLPSLHEVNTFIQDNGHLPGIPSAQEVKENGMSLVEMQVKLLQKVEELTLYSIKQQEEIKALKDELDKLKRGKASSSDSGIQ